MEILNLKVVDKNRFSQLFNLNIGNFNLITVSGNKCITNFKIASSYPTLVLNIKRMVGSSVDNFAVGSGNVQDFIGFLDPNIKNLFKLCFACFRIVCYN